MAGLDYWQRPTQGFTINFYQKIESHSVFIAAQVSKKKDCNIEGGENYTQLSFQFKYKNRALQFSKISHRIGLFNDIDYSMSS